jgi:subtilase family serine protease
VADWPATDPLVTAMGGTQLHLDAAGNKLEPDTVWNDTNLLNSPAASTGGLSTVFSRPAYQNSVSGAVRNWRGVPDISMSAAVDGSAPVFLDSEAAQGPAGFYLIGGTSEATPEFAGIVAIADQVAGHGLGLINRRPTRWRRHTIPGSWPSPRGPTPRPSRRTAACTRYAAGTR